MGAKVTKGQAVRKAKRNVGVFDAALERTAVPGQTATQRDELAAELGALALKLADNRATLLSLLSGVGEGTSDGKELVAAKELIDKRLAQHAEFAESFTQRTKEVGRTLDPEEQSMVDTLAFLISSIGALRAQIAGAEAALERVLSSVSDATSVADQQKKMAAFDALLERNEDRQWHVERLGQVERLFTEERVSVEQVLGLKDAVDSFVKYNETAGFKADRTIYQPLGLDAQPSKPAVSQSQPPSTIAYIHDDVDSAGEDDFDGAHDHFELHDLMPSTSSSVAAAREDDGWEVAVKKKARVQKERAYESAAPSGVPAYEDEMPEEDRPSNYRTVPCREWLRNGSCSFGGYCTFLHGHPPKTVCKRVPLSETTDPTQNPFYRTRPCYRFLSGRCPDGDQCRYLHDQPAPPVPPPPPAPAQFHDEEHLSPHKLAERAKKPCKWHQAGYCEHGNACHFKHADREDGPSRVKIFRKDKYKTALCDKHDTPQGCPYRDACQYAHGLEDLVVPGSSEEAERPLLAPAPPAVFDLRPTDFPDLPPASKLPASPSPVHGKKFPPVPMAAPLSSQEQPRRALVDRPPAKKLSPVPVEAASAGPVRPSMGPALEASRSAPPTPQPVRTSPIDDLSSRNDYYVAARAELAHQPAQEEALAARTLASTPALAGAPTTLLAEPQPALPPPPPPTTTTLQSTHLISASSAHPSSDSGGSDGSRSSQPPPPTTTTMRRRRPIGLLPLGPNACLNHVLRGECLNGLGCLSRHTLGHPDDVAVGLLPLLGPGACLNHFFRGACANGPDCLARHVLTEDDYEALPPPPPPPPPSSSAPGSAFHRPPSNSTAHPAAAAAHATPAPPTPPPSSSSSSSHSISAPRTSALDAKAVARPLQQQQVNPPRPTSPPPPPPPPPASSAQTLTDDDYPDHLSRAVADLVVSDDDEDDEGEGQGQGEGEGEAQGGLGNDELGFVVSDEEEDE